MMWLVLWELRDTERAGDRVFVCFEIWRMGIDEKCYDYWFRRCQIE